MDKGDKELLWSGVLSSGIRVIFSIIWILDAALKWRPSFADNYSGYILNASKGQPRRLEWWFHFWTGLVTPHAHFFAWMTRLLESAIAVALFLGFARKITYSAGLIFTLLVWSTAEGFGGPYTSSATNLGAAVIYSIVFLALFAIDHASGLSPYSLDYYLVRRFSGWAKFAKEKTDIHIQVPYLSFKAQLAVILAILLVTGILIGTLPSSLGASPATSENAAKAVSPLSAEKEAHPAAACNASLPPLLGGGKPVRIDIESSDETVTIADGAQYQAWTFNGRVPGPILHVRQGQNVTLTFTNHGGMQHSIDLHAAEIDPATAYKSVLPGQSIRFTFTPRVPGAFLYHCGTPPVLLHIANGMFGAVVVDPAKPLPRAGKSYVLVQSEWYAQAAGRNLFAGDEDKMEAAVPSEVVFNGRAFQYKTDPLTAKAGERVRLYVVDAGPNLPSAFHVIGAVFDKIYPDGNPSHALDGVSTVAIAPGAGAIADLVVKNSGTYVFVDHSMRDMEEGAAGYLKVFPP